MAMHAQKFIQKSAESIDPQDRSHIRHNLSELIKTRTVRQVRTGVGHKGFAGLSLYVVRGVRLALASLASLASKIVLQ